MVRTSINIFNNLSIKQALADSFEGVRYIEELGYLTIMLNQNKVDLGCILEWGLSFL
jgi:hypothetical protein